jgi:DNA invertase Pin-like site-specific DNA recombinase
MGECMFTIIAAFAQFERSVTVERIKAGLRNAKAKGHLPSKKRRLLDLLAIRERIRGGESLLKVAKTFASPLPCSVSVYPPPSKRFKISAPGRVSASRMPIAAICWRKSRRRKSQAS